MVSDSPRLTVEQRHLLQAHNIDSEMSYAMLARLNSLPSEGQSDAKRLPSSDHPQLVDMRQKASLSLSTDQLRHRLEQLLPPPVVARYWQQLSPPATTCTLNSEALRKLGYLLYPQVAFGILNGGSATSYADRTKNKRLSSSLFAALEPHFQEAAAAATGHPKAICAAFVGHQGRRGDSFLLMKMRHLLVELKRSQHYGARYSAAPTMPLFQMTSDFTDQPVRQAMERYCGDAALQPFLQEGAALRWKDLLAIQKLVAALDRDEQGHWRIFFNREGLPRALPGGHGQSFAILASLYRQLQQEGYRFALLGNIDNLGYSINPIGLALCALRDAPAAFEFCPRSPLDIKGGILCQDNHGRLRNAEIGIDITLEELQKQEQQGGVALFNCAIGLFNLEQLVPRLNHIVETLPYRLNAQENDFGRYWQVEQISWEVIGMLDNPLILQVEKGERFLAAKMLLETLLISGFGANLSGRIAQVGKSLHQSARVVVQERYGYRWQSDAQGIFEALHPLSPAELMSQLVDS